MRKDQKPWINGTSIIKPKSLKTIRLKRTNRPKSNSNTFSGKLLLPPTASEITIRNSLMNDSIFPKQTKRLSSLL